MDKNIYYDIRQNGKYEFISSNDSIINDYLEKAQTYYNLKKTLEKNVINEIYPFSLGEFALYLLHNDINIDEKSNKQISMIRNYILECIIHKNFFTQPILLAFIRDKLKMSELEFGIQYYTQNSSYYEDNFKEANLKKSLLKLEKNQTNIVVDKTYICKDIITFILVSLLEIIKYKGTIHKCINCNSLFIHNSANTKVKTNAKYCNYISPQDKKKICSQYRKEATYQEIRKSNDIYNLHSKISDMLSKRKSRAEINSIEEDVYENDDVFKSCQDDLISFQDWYKEKTKEYKNNLLTEEQFILLLREKHKRLMEEKKNGS